MARLFHKLFFFEIKKYAKQKSCLGIENDATGTSDFIKIWELGKTAIMSVGRGKSNFAFGVFLKDMLQNMLMDWNF
jgi:hypothetical protein